MSAHVSGDLGEAHTLSVALEAEGASVGRELAAQSLGGHLGKGAAQFPVQRCCLAGGPSLGLRLASAEAWAVLQGAAGFFVDLCRTCAQLVLSCMAGRGVRPHPPQFLAAGAGLDMPTCGQAIAPPSAASDSSLGCWCSQPIPQEETQGENSDNPPYVFTWETKHVL